MEHCGIDLHAKSSEVAVVDENGEVSERARIPTTEASLRRWFGDRERMVICVEAGGVSAWAQRILTSFGHDVVVANPQRVRLIAEATLKNDEVDAVTLARLVRADRKLLCPIVHRSAETQRQRGVLRARRTLINARTSCLNASRGILRSFGHRTPGRTAERLAASLIGDRIPEELVAVVSPLVQLALELDEKIEAIDAQVEVMGQAHPAVALLRTIPGVGPLVSLSYVAGHEELGVSDRAPVIWPRSEAAGWDQGLRSGGHAAGWKPATWPGSRHRGRRARGSPAGSSGASALAQVARWG